MEPGDTSMGSTPKYKPRKVSAVRDFPIECGLKHQLAYSNVAGNDVVTVENDSVGPEVMPSSRKILSVEMESQSGKAWLDPTEDAERSLDYDDEAMVAFSTSERKDIAEEMKSDVQPAGLSFPKGIYKEAADSVKAINTGETFKEPVNVEESSAMDNVVDKKAKPMLEVGSSVNGIGERKPISEDGLSVQWIQEENKPMLISGCLVNGSDSVDTLKDLSLMELEGSDNLSLDKGDPLGLNDKFRRRRVSAIRDFPLRCGPNVVGPTDQTLSVHLKRDYLGASSVSNVESMLTGTKNHGTEELLEVDLHGNRIEKCEPRHIVSEGTEKFMFPDPKYNNRNQASAGKEVVLHSEYRNQESKSLDTASGTVVEDVREVVHGIMAGPYSVWKQDKSSSSNSVDVMKDDVREVVHGIMTGPYCPWKQDKLSSCNSLNVMNDGNMKKDIVSWRGGGKTVAKLSIFGGDLSKRKSFFAGNFVDDCPGSTIGKGNRIYDLNCAKRPKAASSGRIGAYSSSPTQGSKHDEILPHVSVKSSSSVDPRNRVKEILRLFQSKCKKIMKEEEAKFDPGRGELTGKPVKRIDCLADKLVRDELKIVNEGRIMGAVPGVEVGDEFQYRVELALIGVHRLYQAGIDYMYREGKLLAVSVVASGAYADDMENPEVLIYSGQGGNIVGKNKSPKDQKLEGGNLALKNSIQERNYVRVVRGSKENKREMNKRDKIVTTYVYDGLYTVDRYYTEIGQHGKMVFMFELRRKPGQPELSWKEVKLSKKYKKRQGVCVDDISGGKESFPVCAVNTLNNEKPPAFTYITKVMYPDRFRPITARGCDCVGRCTDSRKCSCAVKNGGGIPYNYNGAIVEAKPIVFECGPSCKCPPSCYNRVTQRGSNIQLEIFKTESRGWGVRSLCFIPSGTFICEYAGEILEEKEAEQRTNDEYLFDIGRNGSNSKTEGRDPIDAEDEGGYTIDAARYGNIGRFINHSCSPNLYAQDVLNDHDDPRMPHIMLFAAENIPCLQELTYDYNYSLDQVRDSDGNIKVKHCYCGSTVCTGRMY